MDERRMRHVWQNRQRPDRITPLSEPMTHLVKTQLAKRVRQIGQLSLAWDECIPDFLLEHTAIVSFRRGTLTVAVDSARARAVRFRRHAALTTPAATKPPQDHFISCLRSTQALPVGHSGAKQ